MKIFFLKNQFSIIKNQITKIKSSQFVRKTSQTKQLPSKSMSNQEKTQIKSMFEAETQLSDSELLVKFKEILENSSKSKSLNSKTDRKTKKTLSFEENLKQIDEKMIKIKEVKEKIQSSKSNYLNDFLNEGKEVDSSLFKEKSESQKILEKLDEIKNNKMPLPYNIHLLKTMYYKQNLTEDERIKNDNIHDNNSRDMKKINQNEKGTGINTDVRLDHENLIQNQEKYDLIEEEISFKNEGKQKERYAKDLRRYKSESDLIDVDKYSRDLSDVDNIRLIKKEIIYESKKNDKKMDNFKRKVLEDVNKHLVKVQNELEIEKNVSRISKIKLGKGRNSLLIKKENEKLEMSKYFIYNYI